MLISQQDAQAWAERSKLSLSNLESDLVGQIATQVLSRIAQAFVTTGWVDETTTPAIIRSIIAMKYVSWFYNKVYSEEQADTNDYAMRLDRIAEDLIDGIIAGIVAVDDPTQSPVNTGPTFYPTDTSSAQDPTSDDPSLGPASFVMGQVF